MLAYIYISFQIIIFKIPFRKYKQSMQIYFSLLFFFEKTKKFRQEKHELITI